MTVPGFWAMIGKTFSGGLSDIEYAQVFMPFVDIRMMISDMNEIQERAINKAKEEKPQRKSIDDLKFELMQKGFR